MWLKSLHQVFSPAGSFCIIGNNFEEFSYSTSSISFNTLYVYSVFVIIYHSVTILADDVVSILV